MADYDFRSLSSYDLELLVRDLFQAEFDTKFDNFKPGRDGGIDLRAYASNGNETIVQVKHFVESGFQALLRNLSRNEVDKVKRLKPHDYIIATSVPLSPDNADRIAALFQDSCSGQVAVYGRERLNNLLSSHAEIELRHFKLWLSSVTVLQRVLNSDILNQTAYTLDEITHKVRIYVQNDGFSDAWRILEQNHVCIISGEPGIGKTTLAEMLITKYLGEDYQIRVIENVKEGFRSDSPDLESKIVFLFDDFLGQSSLREGHSSDTETSLLKFMAAMQRHANRRFILTTREYILREAISASEKFSDDDIKVKKVILDLKKYSRESRAHILFNHLYFSDLPNGHISKLVENGTILSIIDHPHYNPRIIEWMTKANRSQDYTASQYPQAFVGSLNDPSRVWEYAFERLNDTSRLLLQVLFTLPERTEVNDLEICLKPIVAQAEADRSFDNIADTVRNVLRSLDDSFVSIGPSRYFKTHSVGFYNPSIKEFVGRRLIENEEMLERQLESCVFFDQVSKIWGLFASQRRNGDRTDAFFILLHSALKRTLGVKHETDFGKSDISFVNQALRMSKILPEHLKNDFAVFTLVWLHRRPSGSRSRGSECTQLISLLQHYLLKPIVSSFGREALRGAFDLDQLDEAIDFFDQRKKTYFSEDEQQEFEDEIRDRTDSFLDDFDLGMLDQSDQSHFVDAKERIEVLRRRFDLDTSALEATIQEKIDAFDIDDDDDSESYTSSAEQQTITAITDAEVVSMFEGLLEKDR